jgi:hypothetical protein
MVLLDDIIPNMVKYLQVYDRDHHIENYFKHVAEDDPKKALMYKKAYEKFKQGGKETGILELFCKVNEWFTTSKC